MFSIRRVAAATVLAGAGLLAVGILPAAASDSTPTPSSSPSNTSPSSTAPSSTAPSSSAPSSSAPSSTAPSTSPSTTTPPDECDSNPGVKVDTFDGHAGTAQVSVTTEYEGQELCTDVYFLLASYQAEGADFPSSGHQTVYDTDGIMITRQGTYPLQVAVPDCYYQVDLYQADHELVAQDFDAPNDPLADYLVPGKHANGGDTSCTPAPTGTLGSLACSSDGGSVTWTLDASDNDTGDVTILVNGEAYDTVPVTDGTGTIEFTADGEYNVQLRYGDETLAEEVYQVECMSTPTTPPTTPTEPSPTESSGNALPSSPSETPSDQPSSPGTTTSAAGGTTAPTTGAGPADNGGIQTGSDQALPPPNGPTDLAETGASAPVLPLMAIGAGLLVGGIAVLILGRRRSA